MYSCTILKIERWDRSRADQSYVIDSTSASQIVAAELMSRTYLLSIYFYIEFRKIYDNIHKMLSVPNMNVR